jgi:hypothetical protein
LSLAVRISLVLAAVLAAAFAFAVMRPEDEPAVVATPDPTAAEPTPADTVGDDDSGAAEDARPTATATPRPRPRPPLLTAGESRKLTFQRGDTVVFRVRHDSAEEVHVHGYDISRDLPAGRTVTMRFPAELEGIFEIELELSGTRIGTLQVEP